MVSQGKRQTGQASAGGGGQKKSGPTGRDGGASGGPGANADKADEEPLVAVILADSYDDHFAPLTLNWPRCLLPLANVPLLHYSIESATRTGVTHIYILTRAHALRIRQHVEEALKDALQAQSIGITVLSMPEALSEGDALRDLDAKQVLRSDFLLYRADSVVTLDLKPIVLQHRQRRLTDKDAIMTLCCLPTIDGIAMRSKATRPVHYVDSATQQLLHYETLFAAPKDKATLPVEVLQLDDREGCEEIDIRYDLVEAGVYLCSVDVPPLFSENFDYQSLLYDFIPGILTSDLLDSKIFLHVGKRGFGGRAQDTQTYDAISRDVLRHWTTPIHPASTSWIGERFTERRGWRYFGASIQSDRTCQVGLCSMIAKHCVLSVDVLVTGSILCQDVKIGAGSSITRSHLHDSVTIGANVHITHSIIGRGARILDNVELGHGCLVGADCVIGPNVRLPAGSRVGLRAKEKWEDEEPDDDSDKSVQDPAKPTLQDRETRDDLLGVDSKGVLWPNLWNFNSKFRRESRGTSSLRTPGEHLVDLDDDDDELPEDIENLCERAFGFADLILRSTDAQDESGSEASSFAYDSEFEDDHAGDLDGESEEETLSAPSKLSARHNAVTNLTLAEEGDSQVEKDANEARRIEFEAEARASLARALSEKHSIDNASLELKTLRMASNVSMMDVQRVVVQVLLDQCRPNEPRQIHELVTRWGSLLAHGSQDDEMCTLLGIQTYCATHSTHDPIFVPLLKLFYNEDIVSDEAIIAWWRSKESQEGDERMVDLRTRAQSVVRYILESEDESEDGSEEDE